MPGRSGDRVLALIAAFQWPLGYSKQELHCCSMICRCSCWILRICVGYPWQLNMIWGVHCAQCMLHLEVGLDERWQTLFVSTHLWLHGPQCACLKNKNTMLFRVKNTRAGFKQIWRLLPVLWQQPNLTWYLQHSDLYFNHSAQIAENIVPLCLDITSARVLVPTVSLPICVSGVELYPATGCHHELPSDCRWYGDWEWRAESSHELEPGTQSFVKKLWNYVLTISLAAQTAEWLEHVLFSAVAKSGQALLHKRDPVLAI